LLLFILNGCGKKSKGEPPFSFGEDKSGQIIRDTDLKEYNKDKKTATYEVKYPGVGLTSFATIEAPKGPVIEEVFPEKWRVKYYYDIPESRYSKIPTKIEIYSYSIGKYEKLLNTYELEELITKKPPGVKTQDLPRSFFFLTAELVTYTDTKRNIIRVKPLYFDIQ